MSKKVEKQEAVTTENVTSEQKAMKRGTVIQAVKAIAVLVCICLVCGALLALCHDVFYISDDERFNRSMLKIYPELDHNKTVKMPLVDSAKSDAKYGEVKSVVTDGKVYIIEALGINGYQNGTVTLYVIVNIADAKIVSWVVKENVGQSYIDRVPSTAGKTWYVGKEVSNEMPLEMTGATVVATSTAINNAINMAAAYARNKAALGLGQNPVADAQEAILALLGTEYAAYNLQNASMLSSTIDGTATVKDTFKVGDDEISYIMYADGDNGLVKAYVYGQDAATQKIVAFVDGETEPKFSANLTETDDLVTKVTELNGKLSVIKSGSYTSFGYIVGIDTANGTVYSVSGIQLGTVPKTYVLGVTISTDDGHGKVTAIELKTDGFVSGGPSKDNANKLVTSLVGTTLADIDNGYNSNKVSGATQSANLIRIAVETALRDYDAKLASND